MPAGRETRLCCPRLPLPTPKAVTWRLPTLAGWCQGRVSLPVARAGEEGDGGGLQREKVPAPGVVSASSGRREGAERGHGDAGELFLTEQEGRVSLDRGRSCSSPTRVCPAPRLPGAAARPEVLLPNDRGPRPVPAAESAPSFRREPAEPGPPRRAPSPRPPPWRCLRALPAAPHLPAVALGCPHASPPPRAARV